MAGALALAPLVAAGLAACGSTVSTGSYKGASAAVAQRIGDFQTDVTAGEDKKLCNQDLAARGADATAGRGRQLRAGAEEPARRDRQLRTRGRVDRGPRDERDGAREEHVVGQAAHETMGLVKEGGAWKIDTLQ